MTSTAGGGTGTAALERILRRDSAVIVAALATLVLVAWAYLAWLAGKMSGDMGDMAGMSGMTMPAARPWSVAELAALWAMWAVMMAAMMLPSAGPTVLLVAGVARRRREQARPEVPVALFVMGYLAVWAGFSTAAAAAQLALHQLALLSPAMASVSPRLSGALLAAAGMYQWLPVKAICLTHCRSPLGWLGAEWREGAGGAFIMGVRHGTFCLGCCWALMALLFVAGVMNLLWVAAIAALVLVEKLSSAGRVVGRVAGVGMVMWGVALLVG